MFTLLSSAKPSRNMKNYFILFYFMNVKFFQNWLFSLMWAGIESLTFLLHDDLHWTTSLHSFHACYTEITPWNRSTLNRVKPSWNSFCLNSNNIKRKLWVSKYCCCNLDFILVGIWSIYFYINVEYYFSYLKWAVFHVFPLCYQNIIYIQVY